MTKEKVLTIERVVQWLICDNAFVSGPVLICAKNNYFDKFVVYINYGESSSANYKDASVNLDIEDVINSYNLSKKYTFESVDKCKIIDSIKDSTSGSNDCDILSIQLTPCESLQTKLLAEISKIDFLSSKSINEEIAYFSMAYTLYHEIGHIVHNRFIPESEPLMREKAADAFAFTALKLIKGDFDEKNDVRLLGAMLGIGQILMNRSEKDENEDMEHPHSIERLYTLLDIWCVKDDSIYWDCAYKLICSWVEKYKIYNSWEKIESISSKDKFKDAYFHFRKFYKNL